MFKYFVLFVVPPLHLNLYIEWMRAGRENAVHWLLILSLFQQSAPQSHDLAPDII